jgi:S1-C subfamily serine protease
VIHVTLNSPAAAAGIRAGDVIQSINGTAVKNGNEFQEILETAQIGSSVSVKVRRHSQSLTLNITPTAVKQIAEQP